MIKIISTNPSRNYEELGEVAVFSDEEIKKKVALARAAQKKWQNIGLEARIKRAAQDIKAGMVKINQTHFIKACNPFGGCKLSGLGRENGKFGFHDVTYVKLIAREK